MIYWNTGTVVECMHIQAGLQQIRVLLSSGTQSKAIHYTDVFPQLQLGDQVLLNTTAVELQLGSGGFHFVHTILKNQNNETTKTQIPHQGHMMKLRYTSQQRAVLAAEELQSPYHDLFLESKSLEGMPVLVGELHSMLPIAACWLRHLQSGSKAQPIKIAYIMTDGGALPLAYSNHTAILKDMGYLDGTVTYGQAYGGDIETMNKFTALIAAKHIIRADIAIVIMGPGIAGTGTVLGHTGIEIGELVNAISILGGIPIVMPRISFVDDRVRHQGLSHHTLTALNTVALKRAVLPLPNKLSFDKKAVIEEQIQSFKNRNKHEITWDASIEIADIAASERPYPEKITTMGRQLSDDPDFFLGVCSAAQKAWNVYSDDFVM